MFLQRGRRAARRRVCAASGDAAKGYLYVMCSNFLVRVCSPMEISLIVVHYYCRLLDLAAESGAPMSETEETPEQENVVCMREDPVDPVAAASELE